METLPTPSPDFSGNLFKTLKAARADSSRRVNEEKFDITFTKIQDGPYRYFVGTQKEWLTYKRIKDPAITRSLCGILWAFRYKLVDDEGTEFEICHPGEGGLTVKDPDGNIFAVNIEDLGSWYYILCRPKESITKSINHNGLLLIPIEEISGYKGVFEFLSASYFKKYYHAYFKVENQKEPYMVSISGDFSMLRSWEANFLYNLHFQPAGLQDSLCKYIKL